MEETELLKTACKIHTDVYIHQYLMANADGRQDGALQANYHIKLCEFYTAIALSCSVPDRVRVLKDDGYDLFNEIHEASQDDLTDHLDKVIGFPLKGRPDYNRLTPLFFTHFHKIAMECIAKYNKR